MLKAGLFITSFLYAGLIPWFLKKTIREKQLDCHLNTISFLSNREYFDKITARKYSFHMLLLATFSMLHFWLLAKHYNLGEHDSLISVIGFCYINFLMLALLPHNKRPFELKNIGYNIVRTLHLLASVVTFLSLLATMFVFQYLVIEAHPFLGWSGMLITFGTFAGTLIAMLKRGVNVNSEVVFINGVCMWSIYTTLFSLII